jgi:aspartyl-tRNA synthetase
MVLVGEDNIRQVVAFPKNGSGVDLMMDSPSSVDDAQLRELNISIRE